MKPDEAQKMKELLSNFIVSCHLSANVLEDIHLKELGQALVEFGAKHSNVAIESILYGRKTITEFIIAHVDSLKKSYYKTIKEASKGSRICGSTDIWTDGIRRNSYIDVTLHYIDNFKHKSICIGFR